MAGSAVVREPQGHVEVGAAKELLHGLQVVTALARDAQFVALDTCLDRLGALITFLWLLGAVASRVRAGRALRS